MYYGYMGFFGGFGMILFWVLFVWLVIWLIKLNIPFKETSALDILRTRYAKGEISTQQYHEMKKEL